MSLRKSTASDPLGESICKLKSPKIKMSVNPGHIVKSKSETSWTNKGLTCNGGRQSQMLADEARVKSFNVKRMIQNHSRKIEKESRIIIKIIIKECLK